MKLVEAYCQFDPLEEVWLGDCYPEDFFKIFKDPVRSVFCKITEKTKQDLDHLQYVLESIGLTVCRPKFTNNVEDYLDEQQRLLKPPIAPRDTNMVLGRTLYHLRNDFKKNPWATHLKKYQDSGSQVVEAVFFEKFGYLHPPSIIRIGQDLLIDKSCHLHSWHLIEKDVLPEWSKEFDIQVFDSDGHADSVFCIPGNKKILTSHWKNEYNEFNGWEIHQIPIKKSQKYLNLNHLSNSKTWWVDGLIGTHPAFNQHIEKFAVDWIGYADETVFEVNSLVVNESLIITTGIPDKNTQSWFKKNKIEFVPADMRTRGFWDAGIHCLTVDIRRKGDKRKILNR